MIPDAIGNLAALKELYLYNNQISGKAVRQDRSSAILALEPEPYRQPKPRLMPHQLDKDEFFP